MTGARDMIRVDFACNDPDNGHFTGKVEAVQVYGDLLELESWGRPRKLVEADGSSIRFCGKTWPITASKYGYGNWCWNAYWMEPKVATRFLIWLQGRKLFDCTCGEHRLHKWWHGRWTPHGHIAEFIERQLVKAALAERR